MHVWNVLHAARWKCRTQKGRQKSPSGHHRTTLSVYIFATKAHIDNRKNLLSSDMSSTCSHNMVNFGLLTAEIQSCAMVPRWRFLATFLRPVFSASRVQHISDLHSKFTLGQTMCGSMVDIQSPTAEIRRGKKQKKKKKKKKKKDRRNHRMKIHTEP